MKILLTLLLFAFSSLAFAGDAYYTDPQHGGRHWAPSADGVCYENDKVVFNCGALEVTYTHSFWKGKVAHWRVVDPAGLFAKSPASTTLTPEQAATVVLAQLHQPFYDSGEKRKVRFLGTMFALDAVGTAAGLGGGVCSEAGPIAGHVPVLSLLVSGSYFLTERHYAKATPRFFSTSRDGMAYFIGAEHGLAGVHNLLTCT